MTIEAPQQTSQDLDLAILGLLRERPNHAYGLYKDFRRVGALGEVWRLKPPHFYARVARLEAIGCITSTLEPQGSKPPRKMLRLTDQGRAAFAAWLEQPVAHGRDFRQEFLAKLYFVAQDEDASVAALVARQRVVCRGWLADLERQLASIAGGKAFERVVLSFRVNQIEAILAWLDTCENTLSQ